MKDRPILFSGPMVRAVLDGSKTQTRRVVKSTGHYAIDGRFHDPAVAERELAALATQCPYGQPGDRLWVRETFFAWGRWETRYSAKKGRDEWHFVDMTLECGKAYEYPASGVLQLPTGQKRQRRGTRPEWWKRPAIHVPRVASRITLEITDVRVERLQAISEADANAEGVRHSLHLPGGRFARENFAHLWWSINGDGAWEDNPWVWVVGFKRVAQKEA